LPGSKRLSGLLSGVEGPWSLLGGTIKSIPPNLGSGGYAGPAAAPVTAAAQRAQALRIFATVSILESRPILFIKNILYVAIFIAFFLAFKESLHSTRECARVF